MGGVGMGVLVFIVGMRVGFVMVMVMMITVVVNVPVVVRSMDIKLNPGNSAPHFARGVQMVFVESQPGEFVFQFFGSDAEVNHGADEHVAADAAEDIEIEGVHFSSPAASELI